MPEGVVYVYHAQERTIDVPLYRRERMQPGARIAGPAIIAQDETSTFITASFDARIDAAGCIVMERRIS